MKQKYFIQTLPFLFSAEVLKWLDIAHPVLGCTADCKYFTKLNKDFNQLVDKMKAALGVKPPKKSKRKGRSSFKFMWELSSDSSGLHNISLKFPKMNDSDYFTVYFDKAEPCFDCVKR